MGNCIYLSIKAGGSAEFFCAKHCNSRKTMAMIELIFPLTEKMNGPGLYI